MFFRSLSFYESIIKHGGNVMKELKIETLNNYNKALEHKPVQRALRRVLFNNDLTNIFAKQEEAANVVFNFSNEIKTLPVANQKQSGRCWIFAGLNFLREHLAKKYNLKSFEFSQNYTAFYDKLEKINYFVQSMDDFLSVDADDRTLQHILKTGIQDGGQWDMFVSLVVKYGLVPQSAMVETRPSSSTNSMNKFIDLKLRKYAAEAREAYANKKDIQPLKDQLLEEMYTFLTTCFGVPPTKFDFEYVNDDKLTVIRDLDPLTFYKEYVGVDLEDYISIIDAPTSDKPYYKTFSVSYLGNVIGGHEIKYLNLPINELKELTIKQLVDGEIVWFGSDVSTFGDRILGVWDDNYFDYETMLEMNLTMSKSDQLTYSHGAMNHAMVLTGVHLVDGVSKRFKIENSWGSTAGNNGYYITTDSWFDKFVYQSVINKKYLSKQQLEAWEQKPIILKPWDPMGSLAD